jgi:hypothetical protein
MFMAQADARYMPEIASSTYDAVIDKGTLDAISTGGANDKAGTQVCGGPPVILLMRPDVLYCPLNVIPQAQGEDAANYMIEIWRVLKIGGTFILISTMPPNVLQPLGIAALGELVNGRSAVCNWNQGCRVLPLQTPEGGQVYYYAVKKTAECAKTTSHRSSKASVAPGSKEDIMAGISALLEEARKAKEQMDSAEAQVFPVSDVVFSFLKCATPPGCISFCITLDPLFFVLLLASHNTASPLRWYHRELVQPPR